MQLPNDKMILERTYASHLCAFCASMLWLPLGSNPWKNFESFQSAPNGMYTDAMANQFEENFTPNN